VILGDVSFPGSIDRCSFLFLSPGERTAVLKGFALGCFENQISVWAVLRKFCDMIQVSASGTIGKTRPPDLNEHIGKTIHLVILGVYRSVKQSMIGYTLSLQQTCTSLASTRTLTKLNAFYPTTNTYTLLLHFMLCHSRLSTQKNPYVKSATMSQRFNLFSYCTIEAKTASPEIIEVEH